MVMSGEAGRSCRPTSRGRSVTAESRCTVATPGCADRLGEVITVEQVGIRLVDQLQPFFRSLVSAVQVRMMAFGQVLVAGLELGTGRAWRQIEHGQHAREFA